MPAAAPSPSTNFDPTALEDIPGTVIFTAARSRQAYHLHCFCMSLMTAENREAFKADEAAYLSREPMTEEQRQAVLARDYNRLIASGGNIYFLIKIASTDGWTTQRAVSSMTDMNPEDYAAMMLAGGRSPDGNRSIKEAR